MRRAVTSLVVALTLSQVLAAPLAGSAVAAPSSVAAAAGPTTLPPAATALQAATTALDHFYTTDAGANSDASWRWAPYFMAMDAVYRQTGNPTYRDRLQAWGDRNDWQPYAAVSPTSNPDSRAAVQAWQDSLSDGVAADLAPSDAVMHADLSAPASTYWWIDSLFMGLPLWSRWTARTGDYAYAAKGAAFYQFLKTQGQTSYRTGCTNGGLFDASEDLWWRDCRYVAQRDAAGNKVFWARGNGWVLAALARTLMVMRPDDPQYGEYRTMLRRMSIRLAGLQGSDGLWRSSLLSPALYPAPETSGTALFTYAMAYGIRTGALDRATFLPVVERAWTGLTTTALQGSGFLSGCQGVGEAPAAPSATTSIAYCVGAFALAGSEVAALSSGAALTVARDTFGRTVGQGLGVADVGGAWSALGSGQGLAVAGGAARLAARPGETTASVLPASSSDVDVQVSVSATRPAAGSTYLAVLGRRIGTADYTGRAVVAPNGAVRVQVQRSGTTIRSVDVPGLLATGRLRIRLQVAGTSPTSVRVKVWRADGAEPTPWQIDLTDATAGLQAAGSPGLSVYFSSGGSAGGVVAAYDDLVVTSPASE